MIFSQILVIIFQICVFIIQFCDLFEIRLLFELHLELFLLKLSGFDQNFVISLSDSFFWSLKFFLSMI